MTYRLTQILPLQLHRLSESSCSSELYIISRGDVMLGDALSLSEAQTVMKWLDSVQSYYDEEKEEWIVE